MSYKFLQKNNCKRKPNLVCGFTLVETLVAISILTISILGTFTAVQKGLATSSFAKDQVTAFYLIQEAIEQIRNVRDTNGIQSLDSQSTGGPAIYWLQNLASAGGPCQFGSNCKIDTFTGQITSCSGNCPAINQNTNGLFGYTSGAGWSSTKFVRTVQLQEIVANKEAVIVVTVSWSSGVFNKTITVRQSLFNMY